MSSLFDVWGRTFVQGGTVESVRDVLARSSTGDPGMAIGQTLYGIDHRGLSNSIPINKDYYGLAFFTKPDLRLQSNNLYKVRKFAPLLTSKEKSIPRAIRAMLDSRHNNASDQQDATYPCSLIDPKQAFIPLLTNQLISMSGWQDLELPTHTSERGVYGEEFSFADGICDVYRTWDMTTNFRNIPGDPITSMFYYWLIYAQAVYEGTMTPYANNIVENTIDYQSRIYRIVLDSSKRYVQKIACTGAAFPISVPIGANFNFEIDTPINRNDQISIQWRCIGAEYLDDIIIRDFNATVVAANGDMGDNARQSNGLVKVPYDYIYLFNRLGYPRINPYTFELEWWVYNEDYLAAVGDTSDNDEDSVNFNLDEVDSGDLNVYTGNQPLTGR